MIQKHKELLLKDLCARLPYGVIVQDEMGRNCRLTLGNVDLCSMFYGENFDNGNSQSCCIPFLRPILSMTEEERREFKHMASLERNYLGDGDFYTHYQMFDWLNEHHFDFRGLIEKNLAIDCTEMHIYE